VASVGFSQADDYVAEWKPMRTSRRSIVFNRPFRLKGIDRVLRPGKYEIVTDEELIDGLSFLAYRRVATMMIVPALSHQSSSVEMVAIDPHDLAVALERDQPAQHASNNAAPPTAATSTSRQERSS
jgi:hypothetical protein